MIAGGLPTRVYYASQGDFDTHAGQMNAHERLMGEFNDAVTAFVADLKQQGNFERVLLMTFSEFGRRVAENANGGTDHGAAAPLFVLGGAVKPGLFGKHPSLVDLDHGDLKFNTDFRSVYGTVLDRWLKAPDEKVSGGNMRARAIVEGISSKSGLHINQQFYRYALGVLISSSTKNQTTVSRDDFVGNKTSIVAQIFRVLAEDGFQRKARIEVPCSEPFAVIKRRLVLVP